MWVPRDECLDGGTQIRVLGGEGGGNTYRGAHKGVTQLGFLDGGTQIEVTGGWVPR